MGVPPARQGGGIAAQGRSLGQQWGGWEGVVPCASGGGDSLGPGPGAGGGGPGEGIVLAPVEGTQGRTRLSRRWRGGSGGDGM
jgi:hypothetical protein